MLLILRDEKSKLQEMFTERSNQVEDTMKRLAISDNKVLELRAKVRLLLLLFLNLLLLPLTPSNQMSGLETQVEMLQSTSQTSCSDQVHLLPLLPHLLPPPGRAAGRL